MTRFIRPLDRAEAEARLRLSEREWRELGHGILAVLDRTDGRFLGRTGLKYWPQFEETEIGWALRRDAWGAGLATEAARACLDWSFASIDPPYLTAMIQPANTASVHLARRLGMSEMRQDVLLGDPVTVYSLDRDAWNSSGAEPR